MLQLIYASAATDASAGDHLPELCKESARNNARDEITGVLLALDGHYLQVLEGPREAVENAFLRIITDPRHHDVVVLHRQSETRREFGEWSMKTCDLPADRRATIEQIRTKLADGPARARSDFDSHFPLPDTMHPPPPPPAVPHSPG